MAVSFEFYPDDPVSTIREYTQALEIHVQLGDWEAARQDAIKIQQVIRVLCEQGRSASN